MKRKFKIDRRIYNYAALVRSNQMTREQALLKINSTNKIDDPEVIRLCLKRLGISVSDFEDLMNAEPKTFMDFKNNYKLIKRCKILVFLLCKFNLLPNSTFYKYFKFGV